MGTIFESITCFATKLVYPRLMINKGPGGEQRILCTAVNPTSLIFKLIMSLIHDHEYSVQLEQAMRVSVGCIKLARRLGFAGNFSHPLCRAKTHVNQDQHRFTISLRYLSFLSLPFRQLQAEQNVARMPRFLPLLLLISNNKSYAEASNFSSY